MWVGGVADDRLAGWTPVAGPVAGLFNLLAMVVVGAVDRLAEPSPASAFIGGSMMVLGLIAATITGRIGAARNHGRAPGDIE